MINGTSNSSSQGFSAGVAGALAEGEASVGGGVTAWYLKQFQAFLGEGVGPGHLLKSDGIRLVQPLRIFGPYTWLFLAPFRKPLALPEFMNANQHFIGILVVYSRSYAAKAINEFFSILQALPGAHSMIVVFNDDLQLLFDPRYAAIRGSNANAEFSGWDEGLAFAYEEMGRLLKKNSVFIFANDTFCHHRVWDANLRSRYRRRLSSWAQRSSSTAFGFVDHARKPFVIDNITISSWISTFYFALRYDAICSLGGCLSPRADVLVTLLPASGITHDEFFGVCMDPVLRSHLCSWLFASGKRSWYKAEPLTMNSFNKMRIKASAILAEKILSARLRKSGIGFFPVNRLHSFKAGFIFLCFAFIDSIKIFFGSIWLANGSWGKAGVGK